MATTNLSTREPIAADQTSTITFYADGLCEPINPGGFACWAFVAVNAQGDEIAYDYGCLGHGVGMTNNRAEYAAVLSALEYALAHGWHNIVIRTDSQLVVNQITGQWRCNAPALLPSCEQAQDLGEGIDALFEWVPREENQRADTLSRLAYQEARQQPTSEQIREVAR